MNLSASLDVRGPVNLQEPIILQEPVVLARAGASVKAGVTLVHVLSHAYGRRLKQNRDYRHPRRTVVK
ncbi:hypothetical protein NG798_22580 [Ancylothrix sp. C2]|nr:hypothetical protein [Ancylothrix sp. D3o]